MSKATRTCIILIVLAIITLIAVIIIILHPHKAKPKGPSFLLRTSNDSIQLFDYDSKKMNNFSTDQRDGIAVFTAYPKQAIIYGTEKQDEPVHCSSVDCGNLTFHSREWTKSAMAVDYITDNLYVLDGFSKKIYISDLHSSYYNVLEGLQLEQPKDIVLDLESGYIFILQSSSIIKTKIGTQKSEYVTKQDNLQAFVVDFSKETVYFSVGNEVKVFQYEEKKELATLDLANVTSLAIVNDRLFFIDSKTNFPNNTLQTCRMDQSKWTKYSCELEELYNSPNLTEIKYYEENPAQLDNTCTSKQCDQMCLNREGKCGCTLGWKLKADNVTCYPTSDELYVMKDGSTIAIYNFVNNTFADILKKYPSNVRSFQPFGNDNIFYVIKNPDERIHCSNSTCKFSKYAREWIATGLSYVDDDARGVLYVVDEVHGQVNVAKVDTEYAQTLMTDLDRPRDIVVDSESGLMFVLQASSILKANMDGTDADEIFRYTDTSAIALDHRKHKLYIAVYNAIVCIDYKTNKRHKVTDLANERVISLAIMSDDLFATVEKDFEKRSIQRCHLANGAEVCELKLVHEDNFLIDIKSKVKGDGKQKTACSENNGGCEQFCLLRSDSKRFSCACGIGWKLNYDEKSCRAIRGKE